MTEPTIRSVGLADFPRLLEIQIECINSLTATYTPEQLSRWVGYIREASPHRYSRFSNLAYVDKENTIQAFISWTSSDTDTVVECLYVREPYQNRGIAKILLENAEADLRGKVVRVRSTLNARSFYEHHGYIFKTSDMSRAGFSIACLEKQL